jgi:hypothetical protein
MYSELSIQLSSQRQYTSGNNLSAVLACRPEHQAVLYIGYSRPTENQWIPTARSKTNVAESRSSGSINGNGRMNRWWLCSATNLPTAYLTISRSLLVVSTFNLGLKSNGLIHIIHKLDT